jgi:hypothetical protein
MATDKNGMATARHNQTLNDLLIDVSRSLLQYAVDAWPWAGPDTETGRLSVLRLAKGQSAHAAKLADLLLARGWTIDFGTYPTEYTDLHYVSLDYFLSLLAQDQRELVAEIEQVLVGCREDDEAASVLRRLLDNQREIAAKLAELRRPSPSSVH